MKEMNSLNHLFLEPTSEKNKKKSVIVAGFNPPPLTTCFLRRTLQLRHFECVVRAVLFTMV